MSNGSKKNQQTRYNKRFKNLLIVDQMNRRTFLASSAVCGFACTDHLKSLAAASDRSPFNIFATADDKIVDKQKWARIEKIHDGIFAVVSTPFDSRDFTTVCNGGIIVGDKGVLVVEAYMQQQGAKWVTEQTKKVSKRNPTDIVVTHNHGDHSTGHQGFEVDGKAPRIWLTDFTKTQAESTFKKQKAKNEFKNVKNLSADKPSTVDLGNRKVKIVPRAGHTQSDVTIEVADPRVIFCGDLFFNRMFPNYLDATPSKLNQFTKAMSAEKDVTFVPGHGPVSSQADLKKYVDFLGYVEDKARTSFKKGITSADASKEFKLPKSLDEWLIWSPQVVKRAYDAWYKELSKP